MTKNGFKVMDSDIHIIEPPDLWQRYIDPEFKGQGPRGITDWSIDLRTVGPDGKLWGWAAGTEDSWRRRKSGHEFPKNHARFKPYEERGWTAEVQLGAMEEEGIDVAIIYPSRGLFALAIPDLDPRLAAAVARAYNDWLYEFCQVDPGRLIGAGMLSPFDVEDAVSEAHRCVKELGFKGVFLRPNLVHGRNWYEPYYEPLWSTLEELDVSLGFHEGSGTALPQAGMQFSGNSMLVHTFSHPVEQMMAAGSFCAGGVLARHPNLRVAFLEGNCSWLPFFLWRLDEHWERLGDVDAPELTMPPSEYFKRQCFASAEADEEPMKYVIDYMGNDTMLFSTDFPHTDSKFPRAVERFLDLPIAEEDKRKVLWDNCARYYGLE